jgi:hypothetical protein
MVSVPPGTVMVSVRKTDEVKVLMPFS